MAGGGEGVKEVTDRCILDIATRYRYVAKYTPR